MTSASCPVMRLSHTPRFHPSNFGFIVFIRGYRIVIQRLHASCMPTRERAVCCGGHLRESAWIPWAPARAERRRVPREQCARSCGGVGLSPPFPSPPKSPNVLRSRVVVGRHARVRLSLQSLQTPRSTRLGRGPAVKPVSYTHLTLPTILLV